MTKNKIVICDLDGTLADITHRIHYIDGKNSRKKDYDAFYKSCPNDVPKQNIIALVRALHKDHRIYIVSGRSDSVYKETVEWLVAHDIPFDRLLMRKSGDYTPDNVLKQHWLKVGDLGKPSDILFAIDDRWRIVDMWRKQGITCLQVDYGNF